MPRTRITMLRHGVTIFAEGPGISIGLHFDSGAAIAKVPRLTAGGRSKRPHFECHRVARVNAKGRRIRSMNRGRKIVCLVLPEDLHRGDVIRDASTPIDNLQNFAVSARLLVMAFHTRAFGGRTVRKTPFEILYLAGGTP